MQPRERRAHPRLFFAAEITFASGANFYAGRTRDISAGGLFIETTAALDVGMSIQVRLQILDRTFAVPAEVCWLVRDRGGRTRGVGVRFINVPARMREAIEEFMRQRTPIEFEAE